MPFELIAVLEDELRKMALAEEADILATCADCYMREQDAFQLQTQDVVVTKDEVCLFFGIAERGEASKTGRRQGVRVDTPYVMNILRQKLKKLRPGQKVFNSTPVKYRAALHAAADHLDMEIPPAHSVRHSGPSRDAAEGYRSLPQIQRRGRWTSAKSVLRYSKSHVYIAAVANLPAKIRERGQRILRGRDPRPEKPKE